MKKSSTIFIVAVVLLMTSALPSLAQARRPMGMRPAYGLNLTEEQMVRIEEMRLQFEKEILPLETELQTHYSELRLMYVKNQEQAKIDAKFNQIDKMEIELERRFEAHQMNIRNLLTNEQKMLFDQEGGFRMGLGMDYGGGYGRGPGMGRGYIQGNSRGYGQYYGRGYGRSPGMGRGYIQGNYRGYGQYYGRAYGRSPGMGRGYIQGNYRGYGRGPGMGRGFRCPWFWR